MKVIPLLFFIGCLALVSSEDFLVFPGLNANQSCEINNTPKSGKCVPYQECESESKELCDLYEEVVYVCCGNSLIRQGSVDLGNRYSQPGETDLDCRVNSAEEFSYIATLLWDTVIKTFDYSCDGILISPHFILTAAHCTYYDGLPPKYVQIGGDDLSYGQNEMIKIKRILVHPNYKSNLVYNDIALIELKEKSLKPLACIWQATHSLDGEHVTAIGHSQYMFSDNKANLTISPANICKLYYSSAIKLPRGISEKQICAVNPESEKDTCSRSPGGPIVKTVTKGDFEALYVVGVLSFGGVCGTKDPRVYTRVSAYSDWIKSVAFKSS